MPGEAGLEALPRTALRTSFLVIRPPKPVPLTEARSIPFSAAKRATTGEMPARVPRACAGGSSGSVLSGSGALVSLTTLPIETTLTPCTSVPIRSRLTGSESRSSDGSEDASSFGASSASISAIATPMETVSPGPTSIFVIVPAAGEGSSIATLSVTISTNGSNFSTAWPGLTSHSPITASTTDSPTWGNLIW